MSRGYIIKGNPAAIQVRLEPRYDADAKTQINRLVFQGAQPAIYGKASELAQRGQSFNITHEGPIYSLTTEDPVISQEDHPDRWEVFTESTEKSLFELPDIIAIAAAHDEAAPANDDDSFRKTIETIVDSPSTNFAANSTVQNLVGHLRAGVTGWQVDLIVIRRTRRVDRYLANNGTRITLDTGLYLYTTSQLGLPADVAFALPDAPADVVYGDVTMAKWRWRKRSQGIDYVGNFADQRVELVFAPWSVLSYFESQTSLAW